MSTMPDVTRREFFVLLPLIIVSFILGIYPNIVLDSIHLGVSSLLISVNTPQDFLSNIKEYSHYSCLVPMMIYHNAKTDKERILFDNFGIAGIYQWTQLETGRIYIGLVFNLSLRLFKYFSLSWLKQTDNYISRALIAHDHSTFSLSIIENINITNLSIEDSKELILAREQYYLDYMFIEDNINIYNILLIAGLRLGSLHTA